MVGPYSPGVCLRGFVWFAREDETRKPADHAVGGTCAYFALGSSKEETGTESVPAPANGDRCDRRGKHR